MTRTSVTVPNCPKYSRSFSGVVCHERPPTKSFPGALSDDGVERPEKQRILKKIKLPEKKRILKKIKLVFGNGNYAIFQ